MGAWIALLGLSHYLGSNYLSEMITSSYYFMTIFFSCLVDFLIIGIPGFAILKKWETKHKKLESYVDQCLSDRINKTIEKVETEGVFSISDDMRKHLINCLDPLEKKYTDLFNNKGMPITKKYTQLASKVTASTKFLPKNVLEQTVLLDLATKQMRTGTASEYQTALYQAQQEIKQDDLEYDREMREIARQREEEKHRREILESQKRAEEYAKEQAEYAKQQAIAAERKADYERQRLDTERDAAKNAEKLLEEAKRQTEIQRKQQQMYEEERLRMENERNAKKWE